MGVRDDQITAECGVCGERVELWGPGKSFTARQQKTGPYTRTITYLHVGDCADQWDEVWGDAAGDGAPEETKGGGTEAAATEPAPRQYTPPTLKHYGITPDRPGFVSRFGDVERSDGRDMVEP